MPRSLFISSFLAVLSAACSAAYAGKEHEPTPFGAKADNGIATSQDIRSTELVLDVSTLEGAATIEVVTASGTATFAVGDLSIAAVEGEGGPLPFTSSGQQLDVSLPKQRETNLPVTLTVRYRFRSHERSDGYDRSLGSTMLWPYFCGNLFPCNPSPRDGVRFGISLEGVPAGDKAFFAAESTADAPSYMVAFTHGPYIERSLGTTAAGTAVKVWYFAADEAKAIEGSRHLVAAFDFLEKTYGPYRFGSEVGTVQAAWRGLAAGGMEHHPYWHIAKSSLGDVVTHVHEAAHGWFGNGVRIECWEDFVLSEGLTTYAAARALESVAGTDEAERVWKDYEKQLETALARNDREARPPGCNEIDILRDPLWSRIPYMKGAFFLKLVAREVGVAELDAVLAKLYAEYAGRAAGVDDLLRLIEAETGFDPTALADNWLYQRGAPR